MVETQNFGTMSYRSDILTVTRKKISFEKWHAWSKNSSSARREWMKQTSIRRGGMHMLQSIAMRAVNWPFWPERAPLRHYFTEHQQQPTGRAQTGSRCQSSHQRQNYLCLSPCLSRGWQLKKDRPSGQTARQHPRELSVNHPWGEWFVNGGKEDELNVRRICSEKCRDWMHKH